jgi:signal transduction histidine kinase
VATVGSSTLAWQWGTPAAYGAIAAFGIGAVALVVGLSDIVARPRPIVEPLFDVGLAIAGLAIAAGAGWVVLAVARHEQVFGATALSAFATAATAVLVLPAIWWLRREFLVRRYGRGTLTAEEIASLTADLRTAHDPRQILEKAAEMVRATSGLADTRLVLDDVAAPDGWEARQLLVGDELVGTMLLRPSHPGGLEARQERAARQLLPTVALLARAVALAVEAAHARDDLAHQRSLERARMLADLHDDLGPVLAGMSMRVAAAQSVHSLPELDHLAVDLASCRADLRRIVSGLAPPELRDGDVSRAIDRLVASFGAGSEVRVVLTEAVPDGIEAHAAVVLYRAIAEGVTNSLKHANADRVEVGVFRQDDHLRVEVRDDGDGGVLVPGVGLQSLRDRAEEVGGQLAVGPDERGGTTLVLTIPETTA